jgi:hypothetical protein
MFDAVANIVSPREVGGPSVRYLQLCYWRDYSISYSLIVVALVPGESIM